MPIAARRLSVALAGAILLAATSLTAVAVPAQATTQAACTSDWNSHRDYKDSAGRLAAIAYQYFSADGDTTCVKLVAQGIYYGMSKYMSLTVCDGTNCTTDSGTFKYYAGPLSKADHCISVRNVMRNSAGATIMDHRLAMGSCD